VWDACRVPIEDLKLASPWQRLAAGLIDALICLTTFGLGIALWSKLRLRLGRRGAHAGKSARGRALATATREQRMPSMAMRIVSATAPTGGVAWRNARSPGARLMGIRRVDAATGGLVSVRSALVSRFVSQLCSRVTGYISGPIALRNAEALKRAAPLFDEIRAQHADDPEALQRATTDVYRDLDLHPVRGCLPPLAGLALPLLPALFSRRHQTLPQKAAGILVVREPAHVARAR
jgi:uncharacterized RDD family membrane protein YckC